MAIYSKTVKIEAVEKTHTEIKYSSIVNNKVKVNIKSSANDDYIFDIYSMSGAKIAQAQNKVFEGNNQLEVELPAAHSAGVYLLVIKNKAGKLIYNNKIASI